MEGSTPRESTHEHRRQRPRATWATTAPRPTGWPTRPVAAGSTPRTSATALDVRGKQTGSQFHDNFMGTYTWGAQDMLFDRNTYTKNKSYGLDPHDDSDFLTITNNVFSENGNHGLICSQRCDHLTIRGNKSLNNGHRPLRRPGRRRPERQPGARHHAAPRDHRHGGGEQRGARADQRWRRRRLRQRRQHRARATRSPATSTGCAFSVGTKDLVVADNTITDSGANALSTYQGHRPPDLHRHQRPADEHHASPATRSAGPGRSCSRCRTRTASPSPAGRSPRARPPAGPKFERAAGHVYDGTVVTPGGTTFTLRGTAAQPTTHRVPRDRVHGGHGEQGRLQHGHLPRAPGLTPAYHPDDPPGGHPDDRSRPEEFRRHAHAVVDWIADYRAGLADRPVAPAVGPGLGAVAAALRAARSPAAGGGAAGRARPGRAAGQHALAASGLLRLLPGQRLAALAARRHALRRAGRAGHALVDLAGGHRGGTGAAGRRSLPSSASGRSSPSAAAGAAASRTPPHRPRWSRCSRRCTAARAGPGGRPVWTAGSGST